MSTWYEGIRFKQFGFKTVNNFGSSHWEVFVAIAVTKK